MPTVRVTQTDIVMGLPHSPDACPVALALRRAMPDRDVRVETAYIIIDGRAYMAPDAVEDFIYAFDECKEVEPFTFDI